MSYAIGFFCGGRSRNSVVNLWINGEYRRWGLYNPDEVPDNSPNWGLFEYHPDDQFCRWIDPERIISINMEAR